MSSSRARHFLASPRCRISKSANSNGPTRGLSVGPWFVLGSPQVQKGEELIQVYAPVDRIVHGFDQMDRERKQEVYQQLADRVEKVLLG